METTTTIQVQGDLIPVISHPEHEYVLPTALVAHGYGVSEKTVRNHKSNHSGELVEGKHWVAQNMGTLGGEQKMTLWTKRGIVRLGFFIRSERARLFRDLAEDLVIGAMGGAGDGGARPGDRRSAIDAAVLAAIQSQADCLCRLNDRLLALEAGGQVDGRAKTSAANGRQGGRPKVDGSLRAWLQRSYKRHSRGRIRSRDLYEHYRERYPKAKETPAEVNRAVAEVFGIEKQRWHGRFFHEVGFIGLRRVREV